MTMKALTWVGITMIALGILGLFLSAILGFASFMLVLIFPVIFFDGLLPILSLFLLLMGIVLLIVSFFAMVGRAPGHRKGHRSKVGGVVFIGPFPIFFGSTKDAVPRSIRIALMIIGAMVFIVLMSLLVLAML